MKEKKRNDRTPEKVFEPIEDIDQIRCVRENLKNKPRDLLLFDFVTLTGSRAKDLLGLKAKDLFEMNIGDELILTNSNKGERRTVMITQKIFQTIQAYLNVVKPLAEDYVFKSRKDKEPLTLSSVSHLVKKWYQIANIKSSPGVKSLQKTWELHYKSTTPSLTTPRKHSKLDNTVVKPVQSETLREAVFNELFQAIVDGKIPPGERIIARRIAQQMNVSPMPVRDALGRLEASGFLTFNNKRAYVVNELSQENLHEIYNIRLTLECMAAEAACQRCTEKTYHHLKDLHEQFIEAGRQGNVNEIIRLNRDFHKALLVDANMPILIQILDNLAVKTSAYFHIILFRGLGGFDGITTAALHKRILDGMITRNATKIRAALSEDIMSGVDILDRAF